MKLTNLEIFTESNKICSRVELKDGRILLTTNNGFSFWVANKNKTRVDEINETQYNKAKLCRVTKRNKNSL